MTLNSESENAGLVSPPWLPLRDLGCLMPGALHHDKSESPSRAEHVSSLMFMCRSMTQSPPRRIQPQTSLEPTSSHSIGPQPCVGVTHNTLRRSLTPKL